MIPAEAVEEVLRLGAAFLLVILMALVILGLLAWGMAAIQKRGDS